MTTKVVCTPALLMIGFGTVQEYVKCLEKKDKYSARDRTGPNVVKLENVCVINIRTKFDAVKCCIEVG